MRNRKTGKRKKNHAGRISISFIVIALTLILSVQIVKMYHKDQAYQQQQAQLEAELESEQQRAAELEDEEAYIGSDEYVEDMARTKLGMVFSDEILFKEK